MKPLVIYHANCTDGFGAAFAAWLKLGDEAEYVPMDYLSSSLLPSEAWEQLSQAIPSKMNSDRVVYILDFSLPKPVMDKLMEVSRKVVWLDHHKTAFEMYGLANSHSAYALDVLNRTTSPHYVRLDNNKSGAMLAWEYFHPKTEVPMLIRHIDDYDRWQFKLEDTKAFQKALWSRPWTFADWKERFLPGLGFCNYEAYYAEGEAILRAHEQNVQSVVKGGARPCSIVPAIINSSDSYKAPWVWWHDEECGDTCGANGLAANCPPHLASDVGHELANQSGTFGLLWSIDKDNICKCSLRSNGDYDVSAIAKEFGGGGHKNAAGFTTTIQNIMEWTK